MAKISDAQGVQWLGSKYNAKQMKLGIPGGNTANTGGVLYLERIDSSGVAQAGVWLHTDGTNVRFSTGASAPSNTETGGTALGAATGANTALSNLASVAINLSLVSDTDNTDDLGSASIEWKDLYIDGVAYVDDARLDIAQIGGATNYINVAAGGVLTMAGSGTVDGVGAGNLVDKSASETIAGAWTFSNASGLLTNLITERTAGSGVTLDGVLLKDNVMNISYLTVTSGAQGDVFYHDGSNIVRLAAGTSGKFLKTQGAAANPIWDTVSVGVASSITSPFTIEGGTYDPSTTVTAQTSSAAALTIPDLAGVAQEWVFSAKAQTLTNKILTAPDINGGTADSLTSSSIRSTGAAYDLLFATGVVFTANRTLTITIPDAATALTLTGNLIRVGAHSLTLTTSGATDVTLPTTGTLATTAAATLSSLTSIGTIGTGVWQGTVVDGLYGGTGVANSGKTITLGGNLTTSGAYTITLTVGANTSVTLPASGTLATLAGAETLASKTLTTPTINGAKIAYASKSTDYTLVATDYVIDFSGLAAAATATLPTAAGIAGTAYVIKRSDATWNVVIDGNGAETIDGAATVTLSAQYQFRKIVSNGTNWVVISS